MNRHFAVRGGLTALCCAWGLAALGAGYTWNGGGTDDNWSTGLNWSGGSAPGGLATDDIYLAGTVRLTPDVDLNNPWILGSLSFSSGAGAFTLSGNPLSFQGSVAADVIVNNSGNGQTLDLDLTFAGTGTKSIKAATDNLVLKQKLILNVAGEVRGAADTTIEGIISGTGDLRKDDSGRLVLKGDNTFSGKLTVAKGILQLMHSKATGSTAGLTEVLDGAAIELAGGISVAAEALQLSGSGISGTGALRNISGDNSWDGVITLNGDAVLQSDAGSLTIDKVTSTLNKTFTLTGAGAGRVKGAITTGSGGLIKAGSGTWELEGVSTFTGSVTIHAGKLALKSSDCLDDAAQLILNGGTFALQGFNESVDTLTGAAGAAIDLGSGLLTVGKSNGSAVYSGAIDGVGGALKKVGTGVQTLKGASTFTGATDIDAGALNIRQSSALGTVAGAVTVAKDAALELQKETLDVTVGAKGLTISGSGISGAGALRSIAGNNSWGGTVTLADSARVAVDAQQLVLTHLESIKGTAEDLELYAADTAEGIVEGAINTGTGKVTKLGLGEWVLEAKNSFTGEVQVQAGRLRVKADEALGSTAAGTKVKDGAALILDGGVNLGNEVLTLAGKGTSALEGALCAVEGIAETSGQILLEAETKIYVGEQIALKASTAIVGTDQDLLLEAGEDALGEVKGIIDLGWGKVTKEGLGEWVFEAANIFKGDVLIKAGKLTAKASQALGTIDGKTVVEDGASLVLSGGVAIGAETLELAGDGAGTLGGALCSAIGNNTYGGQITLAKAAAVHVEKDSLKLGTTANILAADLDLTLKAAKDAAGDVYGKVQTGAGKLNKTGEGTWALLGQNTYTGDTVVWAGKLQLKVDDCLNDATSIDIRGGILELLDVSDTVNGLAGVSGSVLELGSGTLTLGGLNGGGTFGGVIKGAGQLVKSGTGTQVLTAGSPDFTGTTKVEQGILQLQAQQALGPASSQKIEVVSGAVLQMLGGIAAATRPLEIAGAGPGGVQAALESVSGTNAWTGKVTLTADAAIKVTAGTLALQATEGIACATRKLTLDGAGTGQIHGAIAQAQSVVKTGAGTWELMAAGDYTGPTDIQAGILRLATLGTQEGQIPDRSDVSVASGATFALNGIDDTIDGLSGAGNVSLGGATLTLGADNGTASFSGSIGGGGVGGNVVKIGSGTQTFTGSNTYPGTTTISNGTLELSGGGQLSDFTDVTVAAGGTLKLTAVNDSIDALNGEGSVVLAGGSVLTVGANAGTGVFDGVISGSGGLRVFAPGASQTLTGPNTYGGVTTVLMGACLRIENDTALGAATGGTVVQSGGRLEMAGGIRVGAEPLSVNGDGGLIPPRGALCNVAGNNAFGGTVTLATNATIGSDSGTLTLDGPTAVSGANTNLTLTGNGTGEVAGVIALGTGTLDKRGNGRWLLSGSNTYSGTTTVHAGVLRVADGAGLGLTSAGTTVVDGAALELEGGIDLGAEPVTLSGASVAGTGALRNISGDNRVGGTVTLAAPSTIASFEGNLSLMATTAVSGANVNLTLGGAGSGEIGGSIATGDGTVDKVDSGTWILSAAGTYSGQTSVAEGTLNVRHGNALGTTAGGTAVAFGAALEVQGGIAVGAEALSVSGAGPEGMGGLRSTAGVNSWSGGISLTGDATFGVDAGSLALRGAPAAVSGTGTSALTKVGDGTVLLEGSMAASVPHLWVKQGAFQYGAGGAIAATGIVNVDGGTFSLQGYSDSVGGVTLFGGTITSTTGILTSATTYDFRNGVCNAALAGTVGITKTTAGTVTLGPNAPSTFAGTVAVDEGVLNVRHGSALGNTASGTQVAAGAAVEVQGNIAVGAEPLTLRGDGVAGTGALRSVSGANSWAGTVTLAANAAIQCDADTLTLAGPAGIAGTNTALALQGGGDGVIQGPVATGNATVSKLGTGTWTLQGANSYTGATLVDAGTLAFDHPGLNTLSSATIAAAGAAATLRQSQGTVNVSGNVDDGGGLSHLSVDNGAMTVNGKLDVDNLTVGFDDGVGSLTVLGAVQVGGSGILDVGRRTGGPGAVPFTSGTLDLTLAPSVNAAMDDIRVATQTAGPIPVHGTLKLASTGMNALTAEHIVVADSTAAGNSFATGTLNFGTINSVSSGSFTIAGRQGAPGLTTTGVADILPGGVLDVGNPGGPGPAVDLYLGDNRIESGGFSLGTLDMTGGVVNAKLGEFVLGRHGGGAGGGQGTFSMDGGSVTAAAVAMGWPHDNGNLSLIPSLTTGVINLNGGTIEVANDITTYSGLGTVNLNGGTLTVHGDIRTLPTPGMPGAMPGSTRVVITGGTLDMTGGWIDIGIAPPGDLVFTGGELRDLGGYVGSLSQDGGVLGVGPLPALTSIGGNYALNGGVIEIGILSPALTPGVDFTQVNVGGTALLDGTVLPLLLDSGTVPLLTSLDVLTASQISLGPAFAVDWSALVSSSGYSGSYTIISGGNLDILRLTIVPEPHDLLLLALALAAVGVCPLRSRWVENPGGPMLGLRLRAERNRLQQS